MVADLPNPAAFTHDRRIFPWRHSPLPLVQTTMSHCIPSHSLRSFGLNRATSFFRQDFCPFVGSPARFCLLPLIVPLSIVRPQLSWAASHPATPSSPAPSVLTTTWFLARLPSLRVVTMFDGPLALQVTSCGSDLHAVNQAKPLLYLHEYDTDSPSPARYPTTPPTSADTPVSAASKHANMTPTRLPQLSVPLSLKSALVFQLPRHQSNEERRNRSAPVSVGTISETKRVLSTNHAWQVSDFIIDPCRTAILLLRAQRSAAKHTCQFLAFIINPCRTVILLLRVRNPALLNHLPLIPPMLTDIQFEVTSNQ